jgi:hypothetical protein
MVMGLLPVLFLSLVLLLFLVVSVFWSCPWAWSCSCTCVGSCACSQKCRLLQLHSVGVEPVDDFPSLPLANVWPRLPLSFSVMTAAVTTNSALLILILASGLALASSALAEER